MLWKLSDAVGSRHWPGLGSHWRSGEGAEDRATRRVCVWCMFDVSLHKSASHVASISPPAVLTACRAMALAMAAAMAAMAAAAGLLMLLCSAALLLYFFCSCFFLQSENGAARRGTARSASLPPSSTPDPGSMAGEAPL